MVAVPLVTPENSPVPLLIAICTFDAEASVPLLAKVRVPPETVPVSEPRAREDAFAFDTVTSNVPPVTFASLRINVSLTLPGRSPVAVRLIAMPSSSAPALCAPLTVLL